MRFNRSGRALALILAFAAPAFAVEGNSFYDQEGKHHFVPEAGFVPDEQTAIRIAEAVWTPIYGRQSIEARRPLRAKLIEGVWHVEGTLPEGMRGGTPEAEIAQADGKILRVSHGK